MTLPRKREKPRSGILRAPQREWPRHRKYIRSLNCCVPGCLAAAAMIRAECAHVRTGTDGGISIKPSDWWCVPLCPADHKQQHQHGERAFERANKVDLKVIALGLARQSPDLAMREAMKLAGVS